MTSRPNVLSIAAALFIATIVVLLLKYTAPFFIPLVLAVVIWFILITISEHYERISILGKHMPSGIALLLSMSTVVLIFILFGDIVQNSVAEFMEALPLYQEKLASALASLEQFPYLEKLQLNTLWERIDLPTAAGTVFSGVNTLAGYTITTLIYLLFILLEYRTFGAKLNYLFPDPQRRKNVSEIIERINADTMTYVRIQTFISVLTAICVYIILIMFGVQFAGFWALLTLVLNFIPTIGSIIASILPPLFALVQLESIPLVVLLAVIISVVQFVLGNVLQPRMMGSSLNLSPLVIIISLSVWGMIWGIVGMFLCIPIMVIANIIFARFPQTNWIAVLLSADGNIP